MPLLVETTTAPKMTATFERRTRRLDMLSRHLASSNKRAGIDTGIRSLKGVYPIPREINPGLTTAKRPGSVCCGTTTRERPGEEGRSRWRDSSIGRRLQDFQLRLLSGVGPADARRRHEIPAVGECPGTGRNLQDRTI